MVTVVYKIALEIWGTPPLKKLVAQRHHNFSAISDNFATWSQISPYWNKISSIGEHSCTCLKLGERWSRNGEK